MLDKVILKPIKSQMKLIIVESAEELTAEAQNALLKVLEEPPDHTCIMLQASSSDSLLTTIISRCQIISFTDEEKSLNADEKRKLEEFIRKLHSLPVGERLKKAESLGKNKEDALVWTEKIIRLLHHRITVENDFSEELIYDIKKFQELHRAIKTTNVNIRFAVENTLLQL